MLAFLWFMAVFAVVLAVVGPKRHSWAVQASFRRDPEATEPSDLGYTVGAVAKWIVADDISSTDHYQVTNRKGQNPVCLAVTTRRSPGEDFADGDGADTEVTDGACPGS